MKTPTREEVQAAVETIIAAGKPSLHHPETAERGVLFAYGISKIESDPRFLMIAAAEHCENWNYHNDAAAIRKMIS